MTYNGPDHQTNLLRFLQPKETPTVFTIVKNTVLDVISSHAQLKKTHLMLQSTGDYKKANEQIYQSTIFVYQDNQLPCSLSQSSICDLSNAIAFVRQNTLPIIVPLNELKKCDGCIIKTNKQDFEIYIQISNNQVYVNGMEYFICESFICTNGVVHILSKINF